MNSDEALSVNLTNFVHCLSCLSNDKKTPISYDMPMVSWGQRQTVYCMQEGKSPKMISRLEV